MSLEYPALSVLPLPPPPEPPARNSRSPPGGGRVLHQIPREFGGQPSLANVSDQVIWEAGVAPECQARSVGRERPPPRTLGVVQVFWCLPSPAIQGEGPGGRFSERSKISSRIHPGVALSLMCCCISGAAWLLGDESQFKIWRGLFKEEEAWKTPWATPRNVIRTTLTSL